MSTLATNAITDAAGGNTATINSFTPTVSNMAGRNHIINGNFDIWQRGTSFTNNTVTQYTADRWQVYGAGTSTLDITRQSFAAGQTDVEGNPKYFIRLDNTPDADVTWMELFQRIEDVTYFSNITVTLSFWIKANRSISGNDFFIFTQNFGSGGSTSVNTSSSTFNISTSWEKKTLTVNLPSISGKTVGSSSYLEVHLVQNSGVTADTYYDIAQVQFETGSVATPFERRQYGQELALCERYYQKTVGFNTATGNDTLSSGAAIMFKTEMRASPTPSLTAPLQITKVNAADFAQSSASVAIAGSGTRVNTIAINLNFANFTGLPTDSCLPVIITGGAITLSAEL
jgi:hypothetical protein